MSAIQMDQARLRVEWDSGILDERLKIVLRAVGMFMNGIRLTCLKRDMAENAATPGAVGNSKHIPNKDGKVLAADFNPPWSIVSTNHDQWRMAVKQYCDRHFRGVDCIIKPHGTAPHVHLEIDPPPGLTVELLA
jgi:hypothetical protein